MRGRYAGPSFYVEPSLYAAPFPYAGPPPRRVVLTEGTPASGWSLDPPGRLLPLSSGPVPPARTPGRRAGGLSGWRGSAR